ncbi:MAG: hypothetical protein ACYDHX_12625 [Methanothrix sp.]
MIAQHADVLQMLAREGARLLIMGVASSLSCSVTTTNSGYTGGRWRAKPSMRA